MKAITLRSAAPIHASLALMLSLATLGCGGDDEQPERDMGIVRVRYGDTWKDINAEGRHMFAPGDIPFDTTFTFCRWDTRREDPQENTKGLCVHVDFESFPEGAGPATYTLDGTARHPAEFQYVLNYGTEFEPGPAHAPEVKGAWVKSGCKTEDTSEAAVQQVSGQLVLTENSKDRIAGHLTLAVTGKTGGFCPGDAAEVDIDFEFPR
ncbi:hypothetical protein HPC49_38995 [Pyxidicoccus fallax]|uniref:Lipoprotein n=1 Tax=Pyxidicoccus fallax TaxID=394095 RepID=A0A848LSJ9_9BACT|nr:hypothetical protein [Pyxidicoccus fallax]NMO20602.1 hypothetical protein [Pyxidicoccus fallax]NPC84187.1 hypothetical protein [Pyxidicoccus fallax]